MLDKFPRVDARERTAILLIWLGLVLFIGVPWWTGIVTLIHALLNAF
jgi:hypothetical protein